MTWGDAECCHCEETIEVGDTAVRIVDPTSRITSTEYLLHVDCSQPWEAAYRAYLEDKIIVQAKRMPAGRGPLLAKFAGTCRHCGDQIDKGTPIAAKTGYGPRKTYIHLWCAKTGGKNATKVRTRT
jgi:hypothetical protein